MRTTDFASLLTENQFQEKVVALAQARGWLVHHTRPARWADGSWSTPLQGDPGFPDLVCARRGRLIVAELKSERGLLTSSQRGWLRGLTGLTHEYWATPTETRAGVVLVAVWRPSDWPHIVEVLT